MTAHEQFAEDLALHALGALQGDERAALEKHLDTCTGCRQELEHLRGDMALMAMASAGPKPPQRARQRLLDAVAKEPRVPSVVPGRSRFNWWAALGWAAAAAMFLVVVQLRRENVTLRESVSTLASLTGQQTIDLANAKRVLDTLTAPEAQSVTLVAAKAPPQPQGKARARPTAREALSRPRPTAVAGHAAAASGRRWPSPSEPCLHADAPTPGDNSCRYRGASRARRAHLPVRPLKRGERDPQRIARVRSSFKSLA